MSVPIRAPFTVRREPVTARPASPRAPGSLYLAPSGEKTVLWQAGEEGTPARVILELPQSIKAYHPSPDGRQIAVVTQATPLVNIDSLRVAGVPYDMAYHRPWQTPTALLGEWLEQLWLYEVATRRLRRLWEAGPAEVRRHVSSTIGFSPGMSGVSWAPTGTHLAVEVSDGRFTVVNTPGWQNWLQRLMVFDTASAQPVYVSDTTGGSSWGSPVWAPDGRHIVFWSEPLAPGRSTHSVRSIHYQTGPSALHLLRVADGALRVVPNVPRAPRGTSCWSASWLSAERLLVQYRDEHTRGGGLWLTSLTGEGRRVGDSTLSLHGSSCAPVPDQCQAAPDLRRLACVRQSVNLPPELVLLDLASGRMTQLTQVNRELATLPLHPVRPLDVVNRYGYRTRNWLVVPRDARAGTRHPLLVALYSFNDQFALDDQWIHSFPVQLLADRGFAVLLTNYPVYTGATMRARSNRLPRMEEGIFGLAGNPLASIVAAVRQAVADGIADSTRVGIMGFSYGGFLTQYAITQAPDLFAAALVNDGGRYNPMQYWTNGPAERVVLDDLLGGSPWAAGPSAAAWRAVAPAFNAAAIRAPVLFEQHNAGDEVGLGSSDILTEVACQGKAYEVIQYFGAEHSLARPWQQRSSMERTLDWFAFWLQGEEDPNPAKREPYARWRQLRTKATAARASQRGSDEAGTCRG